MGFYQPGEITNIPENPPTESTKQTILSSRENSLQMIIYNPPEKSPTPVDPEKTRASELHKRRERKKSEKTETSPNNFPGTFDTDIFSCFFGGSSRSSQNKFSVEIDRDIHEVFSEDEIENQIEKDDYIEDYERDEEQYEKTIETSEVQNFPRIFL